jgi:hypothetical protein
MFFQIPILLQTKRPITHEKEKKKSKEKEIKKGKE